MKVLTHPQEIQYEAAADDRKNTQDAWKGMYRAGGIAALLAVLVGLIDIAVMFLPGTGSTPGTRSVMDWFNLFRTSEFLALRDLGLLNMITTSCTVLVFFALFGVHRRSAPLLAGLALILIAMGTTIYLANNTALPMLTLSRQYTAAQTEAQKALWTAAGQVLLAQEDISAGSFLGFFIPEIAGVLMGLVMLRGKIFSRGAAWMGLLGEGCLIIFNISAAFVPSLYDTAMIFAMIGGPLSMLWLVWIALKLFGMERS